MSAVKLTAKETALLTAIGAKYFSFFDDGIVAGGGIWVNALTEEIAGNSTYPVSDTVRGAATVATSLARKGYAVISGDVRVGDDDGRWFELTELGAETANALAPEPAPLAPAAPATPAAKKARKAKKADPEPAPEAPADSPVISEPAPVIPEPAAADAGNYTTKTWSDETADYGTEEWIRWDFSDGSYAERRRRKVSGAWRTDFWGAAADGKRVFTLSGVAKAARAAGKFTA